MRTVWCVCLFRMLNSNALHRIAHHCSNIEKTFLHRILKFSTSNIDHKNQRYNKIVNMSQYFLSSVVNEIHKYYKYFILKMKKKRTLFSSNDIIKNRHHPMPCCRRRQRRRRHHWKRCLNANIEYGWKSNGEKSLTNESSARVFVNDNTEQTENDLWASFKKQLKIVSFCAIWWRCILLARNFNNVTLSFAIWRFKIFFTFELHLLRVYSVREIGLMKSEYGSSIFVYEFLFSRATPHVHRMHWHK